MNRFKIFIILGILLGTVSCSKDFLDADLQTTKRFEDGVKTPRDMHNLVMGVYNRMNESTYYGRDFIMFGELRSDNAYNSEGTGRFIEVGSFDMLANETNAREPWQQMYACIQLCNVVINNTTVTEDDEVKFYKGQALALRALVYFDLNRLFGQAYVADAASPALGVPLVLTFDNTASSASPGRSTLAAVNAQIEKDFLAGIALMNGNDEKYKIPKNEMNTNAAHALLGRYYLYNGKWADCITHSKPLVVSGSYPFIAPALYQGSWTLGNAGETIFELSFTDVDNLGTTGYSYMWAQDGYDDIYVHPSFESLFSGDDVRSPYITGASGYSLLKFPYEVKSHNVRVIHIGEVYMNYVEACVKSGVELSTALGVVNSLRSVRHSSAITGWTLTDLTEENVLAERRLELSLEGHRYFDLCRTGTSFNRYGSTGSVVETLAAPNNKLAFPIPEREMDANPNLVNQNPGY